MAKKKATAVSTVVYSGSMSIDEQLQTACEENKVRRKSQSKKKASLKNTEKTETPKNTKSKSKAYSSVDGLTCPECGSDMISKAGPRKKKCDVCRHQWV